MKLFEKLSQDILAVDFGSNELKGAMVKCVNKIVTVNMIANISTPRNAIRDGRILDADKMGGILSVFIKDNFPSAKFIVATVQSSQAMTRELILPVVNASDVENLIKYEIENRFPIDPNKYLLEYTILEKFTNEEGLEKIRVFVAVMPKDIVQGYFDLFKALKLTPYALDFNSNALSKLFREPMVINKNTEYHGNETVALVDLGAVNANVTILKGGNLRLTRLITLPDDGVMVSPSANYNWVNDVDRIIQYYLQYEQESSIPCVFLHGGGALAKGIAKVMGDILDVPVYLLDKISYLRTSIMIKDADLGRYYNAIGAAIRLD